tara:strand:- start:595 stop:825 length:231 start_codon:yes stop_codon:yes gene_type:complete
MIETEKFLNRLSKILEVKKIKDQDKFEKLKEWDSLAMLSVIALVNEMYKITISAGDFKKFKKVGNLLSFIKKKKKK